MLLGTRGGTLPSRRSKFRRAQGSKRVTPWRQKSGARLGAQGPALYCRILVFSSPSVRFSSSLRIASIGASARSAQQRRANPEAAQRGARRLAARAGRRTGRA